MSKAEFDAVYGDLQRLASGAQGAATPAPVYAVRAGAHADLVTHRRAGGGWYVMLLPIRSQRPQAQAVDAVC
jgi:CelD/BcsL family acetyltransferase involved in cellulose biosynthesis